MAPSVPTLRTRTSRPRCLRGAIPALSLLVGLTAPLRARAQSPTPAPGGATTSIGRDVYFSNGLSTTSATPPADGATASPTPAETPATAASPVGAPLDVKAVDTPNDAGNSVDVSWTVTDPEAKDVRYVIERRKPGDAEWTKAGEAAAGGRSFQDAPMEKGNPLLANGQAYEYRVVAMRGEGAGGPAAASAPSASVVASATWFNRSRTWVFGFLVLFFAAIAAFIELTRRGRPVFIRPIAGLKALEEAVGRATEMGKPVFFMPGIDEANNIQTLFGMVILGHVTKLVAQYETPLIVVVGKAFVVPLAEETVKQGFIDAGRPELYKADIVRYYSDEQFATVTAIAGIFLRERPATNLYFGSFYAESLILAETGFTTGAIQIAGTGNIHQLPFFVVACDYTLVGEEFFAVSAYLSKEPKLLGTLKATDLAKAAILVFLTIGCLVATKWPDLGATMASWFNVQ